MESPMEQPVSDRQLEGMIRLLEQAGAVRFSFPAIPTGTVVSPLLNEWCMNYNGALAHFCWGEGTEGDLAYDIVLTREGLASGTWSDKGFVCKDRSGRTVCMQLFKVDQYTENDMANRG